MTDQQFRKLPLKEQLEIINLRTILSKYQAGLYLGVGERTITDYLEKGLLKSINPPNYAVRIKKDTLEALGEG